MYGFVEYMFGILKKSENTRHGFAGGDSELLFDMCKSHVIHEQITCDSRVNHK